MSTAAGAPELLAPARREPVWDRVRLALLAAWVLVAVAALAVGVRPGSREELVDALAAGRVGTVSVRCGPEPGTTGYAVQEVRWDDGRVDRWCEVVLVTPGAEALDEVQVPADGGRVSTDVGAQIARDHPGVSVVQTLPATSSSELWGWRVPVWLGLASLAVGLGAFVVLVAGPQPWRATRWAWFWLFRSPLLCLAFLLLAGPTPLVPAPRPGRRRLTGGWAFLLSPVIPPPPPPGPEPRRRAH